MARRKTVKNRKRKSALPPKPALTAVVVFLAVLAVLFLKPELLKEPAEKESTPPPVAEEGEFLSYYIDVGQGDCELVRIPEQDGTYFNLLIDSGDAAHGEDLVKTLRRLGVDTFDAVVVTHPHADHMGSMGEVLREFGTERFYMTEVPESQTPTTVSYEKMLDALAEIGGKIQWIGAGDEIPGPDSAVIRVLAPEKGAEYGSLNDYSAILKISYGETAFLYLGDAEEAGDTYAMENGSVRADVVKIGHHGSSNATDDALIRAVGPDYAVISCGRDNEYGHPHRGTLEILENHGVKVLRTDELGTILISSDGAAVKIG